MSNQQALLKAANDGNLDDVRRLVDAGGVDLNPPAGLGRSHPLLVASEKGHLAIVCHLLELGAAVNQVDDDRAPALTWAAANNHANVVRLLLQFGAHVNAQTSTGWTALHSAAGNGQMKIIRVLLDHGADRTLKNNHEKTAEDFAREQEKQSAAELLRDYVPVSRASDIDAPSLAPQSSPAASVVPPSMTGQTDELASLRAQLQATTDELAAARAQHVTWRQELEAANAAQDTMKQERDSARAATRRAEAEAAMEVRLADQRTTELRACEAQLATIATQKQAVDARLEERERDYADLTGRHTVLTTSLRTLESAPQITASHVTLEPGVPRLGKGALGEVLAARYHGVPAAIKRLFALQEDSDYGPLTPEEAAGVRRELRRECETLARLRSPFLVAYYGFTVRESEGGAGAGMNTSGAGAELPLEWVVMERLEPLSAGPRDRARHVLYCLARALQYLHERGIIHRDVKPTNILYDRKNDVYKLSDLGEAQLQSRRATLRTQYAGPRGTIDYMAPEMKNMIEGDEMTDKIDVFSFAVTAIELLIGAPPTLSANAQRRNPTTRQLESIPEVERRAGDLARLAEGAPVKAMVIRCLVMNPEERPSAKECAEHFDA